jgi:hypothetical protein
MSGRTERGAKERGVTAAPFSPPEPVEGNTGRRWPEGPDEGQRHPARKRSLPASRYPHFSDDNENLPEHRHGVKDYFPNPFDVLCEMW